jgi:amino acid adenylation domain-containing protein
VCQLEVKQDRYITEIVGLEIPSEPLCHDQGESDLIHGMFENQAQRTPHCIAVVGSRLNQCRELHLTYSRLNEDAGQLARRLRANGASSGTIVAIIMPKSLDLIIGIIGILKTGAAYLPINPDDPPERVRRILEDSKAEILVDKNGIQRLDHDENSETVPSVDFKSTNLAYIIYTSGSTGTPKGVPITHGNLSPLLRWGRNQLRIGPGERTIQNLSYYFDWSVWEIFITLCYGGSLYMISDDIQVDSGAKVDFIIEKDITVLHVTPTQLHYLLETGKNMYPLKYLCIGAEKLILDQVKRAVPAVSGEHGCRIFNMYGPTEATIISAVLEIEPENLARYESLSSVPIGHPAANAKLKVLDEQNQPCPVGEPGGLYIAGDCLARGYLNNPELTKERFETSISNYSISSISSESSGPSVSRLYKTGDRVRMLEDGTIEFLGRMDDQVKIRGYRIELGEIEQKLSTMEGINNAVVVDGEGAGKQPYLCGYYVSDEQLKETDIREYLEKKLPGYMIPQYFIRLETIPLNPNGKLDRKKLPEPDFSTSSAEPGQYAAPVTPAEIKLTGIWENVLKVENIGTNDDFVRLGGHSLSAAAVSASINKEFGVDIPVSGLFNNPTVKALARCIDGAETGKYDAVTPVEDKEYYRMAPAQKRMFIVNRMENGGIGYNIPSTLRLNRPLDPEKTEAVIKTIIQRHESLRTSFHMVKGEAVQRIHRDVEFHLQEIRHRIPVSTQTPCRDETGFLQQTAELIRPFDLGQAPLLRAALVEQPDGTPLFFFDMHHIISDRESVEIFIEEFKALYLEQELQPLPIRYRDYTKWHEARRLEQWERLENYWLSEFSGELPQLNQLLDHARSQSIEGGYDECGTIRFKIPDEMADPLRHLAVAEGTTLYMVMLAAYNLLWARISGQEDIIVGTPLAGRGHTDLTNIIGMFVNTLALRNYPTGKRTFADFLAEVKKRTLTAFENQDYPLEDLVEKLNLQREPGRNPLFDIVFALNKYQDIESGNAGNEGTAEGKEQGTLSPDALPEIRFGHDQRESQTAKFDQMLTVEDFPKTGRLEVTLEYRARLFNEETMWRYVQYFETLLTSITHNPGERLANLDMIGEERKREVLELFNDTRRDYPDDKTVTELFREQKEKTPYGTALVGRMIPRGSGRNDTATHHSFTYEELDKRSNRMALSLRERGVQPHNIVAVTAERTPLLIMGLLAILKAGAAYLPIEPDTPDARRAYQLKDSSAVVQLNAKELSETLTDTEGAVHSTNEGIKLKRGIKPVTKPGSPVYIIYTSGSTGKPKGVVVEHRNVVRLVKNTDYLDYKKGEHLLQSGAVAFDVSTFEIWGSLLNGLALHLPPKDTLLNPRALKQTIRRHDIGIMWMTSPLFTQMVDADPGIFKGLRRLLVGGDVLSPPHIERIRRKYPLLRIINGYGPTENSTFSTTHHVDREYRIRIPIGKPIANSTAYILDRYGNLQPVGVPGELYVGGDGVARGYMNNPELTAERFVEGGLYKTGDLARWLPGGIVDFLGRMDNQVKIRGFRIELGEIEDCLLDIDGINETIVMAGQWGRGDKQTFDLCAYYVAGEEIGEPEIKAELSQKLPHYMYPTYYVRMEKFPLNPNGKVDRKKLPPPEVSGNGGTEPETPTQKALAKLWQQVLAVDTVGTEDDFFRLGGHSLAAVGLGAEVHKRFGVDLSVAQVFMTPTLVEQASYIDNTGKGEYRAIPTVEQREYYPMSSTQKRMFILNRLEGGGINYNIPSVMILENRLDEQKTADAFRRIIQRHETLRTSFILLEGEPVQRIHPEANFELQQIDMGTMSLVGASDEEILNMTPTLILPFRLTEPPLMRVKLANLEGDRQLFFLEMHHIVSDKVSIDNVINEFRQLYKGEEPEPLNIQYRDYAQWQEQMKNRNRERHEKFWLKVFTGEIPVLSLPLDYPRPAVQSFDGHSVTFEIDASSAGALRALAAAEGTTLYMVLLAIYNIQLAKLSGQEDIIVGSPVAGRNHADLADQIGMFVNTLALRNNPAPRKTVAGFLAELKMHTLEVFENQDYPFEDLVEKVNVQRDPARNPLFDVVFTLNRYHAFEEERTGERLPAGLRPQPWRQEVKNAKFDITLAVEESDDKDALEATLEYCTRLFKEETIRRFSRQFLKLITEVTADPGKEIDELEIITDSEKKAVLQDFNRRDHNYDSGKSLTQLLEEQVARTPRQVAVVDIDGSAVSYEELNRQSLDFAVHLRSQGVEPGSVVAIKVDRSLELIVGIIGIVKTGAAYLPINPRNPADRTRFMLEDSNTVLLVTTDEEDTNITTLPCTRPMGDWRTVEKQQPIANGVSTTDLRDVSEVPEATFKRSLPDELCYIIYTSGSTGKPKGVAVKHGNLCPLLHWGYDKLRIGRGDRTVQNLSYFFDWSVWEIFITLTTGASLYMITEEVVLNPKLKLSFMRENAITVLHLTPTQQLHLLNAGENDNKGFPQTMRYLFIGAERLTLDLAKRSLEAIAAIDDCRVFNLYGPTEATIMSASLEIFPATLDNYRASSGIPIGTPVANAELLVLDRQMRPCPIGVAGELYIGGNCLARGYLNNPELTKERFKTSMSNLSISSSSSSSTSSSSSSVSSVPSGAKLYKTGDRVRWLADGTVEFLGRIDFQVKIRGYRIELGEIENKLNAIDEIRDAVVLDGKRGESEQYLCAYYVSDQTLSVTTIRQHLEKDLPGYMIPQFFVPLEKLPLNPNGKVDRNALPEPEGDIQTGVQYVAPSDKLEEELLEIWQQELSLETIGIHDNLFALGGNSMMLLKIQEKIDRLYPGVVEAVDMFTYPTIAKLAAYIRGGDETSAVQEDRKETTESFSTEAGGDVAVIGLALKIGSTENPEEFWSMLVDGKDFIRELPETRRRDSEILVGKRADHYQEAAYLDEIDKFDHAYFKISPREARLMDPHQRLFLQAAITALEDAGYGGNKLRGSHTGVFVGFSSHEEGYGTYAEAHAPGHEGMALAGNLHSIIAGRISYIMDFHGPAQVIDTACSSGLVAMHTAVRSIRSGESTTAIAGAVKIMLNPEEGDAKVDIVSSDGRTRAFDDASDGTGSGEGVIVVLLKSLQQARRDGDRIHAVIKGSAVNQDGDSIGITAPNANAQADVLQRAWKDAGIEPTTISYIEAHGTGTKLGDPIEIKGITHAFLKYTGKKQFCSIGSVKTNIGHLDSASGMAGLLKAILALKNKQIPPLVHFKAPNRKIDFQNSPVFIDAALREWKSDGTPLRCGVSSFGMSGTNCHVILEEAPERLKTEFSGKTTSKPNLLTISARTLPALKTLITSYCHLLSSSPGIRLEDICYTANTGRGHYNFRLAILADGLEHLEQILDRLTRCTFDESTESVVQQQPGVYFRSYRIVPLNKKNKGKNEYTEDEIEANSRKCRELLSTLSTAPTGEFMEQIALMYIAGADIDWEKLHQTMEIEVLKVGLPVYPFEKTRCWVEKRGTRHKPTGNSEKQGIGDLGDRQEEYLGDRQEKWQLAPLLDELVVETDGLEIYRTFFDTEKHWLLNEHRVNHVPTLVGTAYLELALELWQLHNPGTALEVHDMTIATPLSVPEGHRLESQILLQQEDNDSLFRNTSFRILTRSGESDKQWHHHAHGRLSSLQDSQQETLPPEYDLRQLKNRCSTPHLLPPPDQRFNEESHVQVSPRWHGLKTLHKNENHFLGHLELPDSYHSDLKTLQLHPPLLDAALHFALAAIDTTAPFLPLHFKKTRIYGKTPSSFYAYARQKINSRSNGDIMNFDIDLMTTDGTVFATFEDYTLKKIPNLPALFHQLHWIPIDEPSSSLESLTALDKCLRRLSEGQEGSMTQHSLKPLGTPLSLRAGVVADTLLVGTAGEHLEDCLPWRFDGALDNVLESLEEKSVARIIFYYRPSRLEETEESPQDAVMALFQLIKALNRKFGNSSTLELIVVTENAAEVTGTEETIHPQCAALVGLAKVVRLENPRWTCRCIDVDRHTGTDTLVKEIQAENREFHVALRNNRCYVEEFRPARHITQKREPEDVSIIKENGVYLITGGLGGIGLELAKYLAQQKHVRLILINRTLLPPKDRWTQILEQGEDEKTIHRISQIKTIEENGSTVEWFSADVTDVHRMKTLLDDLIRRYGQLNGIIHSAGVAGDGFMTGKDDETFRQVLAPKIQGTHSLDRLTRHLQLDFFVLCSSLTTLTGSPGQGDYTAANYYQDAYAAYRNKTGRPTMTINWPGWKEVGMAKDYGVNTDGYFKIIYNTDAIQAFHISLQHIADTGRLLIGQPDYRRMSSGKIPVPVRFAPEIQNRISRTTVKKDSTIRETAPGTSTSDAKIESNRLNDEIGNIQLKGRPTGNFSQTEMRLAAVWAGVLGFDTVDIYDNFYDQGGDSINALHIVNRANKTMNAGITVTDVFTTLTVESLAALIDEKKETGDPDHIGESLNGFQVDIPIAPKKAYYPVSSAQKRVYVLESYSGDNTGYNLPLIRIIEGTPDIPKLEQVMNEIMRRHETLRTSFSVVEGQPVQVVHEMEDTRLTLNVIEPGKGDNKSSDSWVEQRVIEFIKPFNLAVAPLMRVQLVKLSHCRYIFLLDLHHIIADGMSCDIFMSEMIALYSGQTLPELKIQYKDFTLWHNRQLAEGTVAKQREYWISQLGGGVPVSGLPTDYHRPPVFRFEGDTVDYELDRELTGRLKRFAVAQSVTPYMVVLTAFNIVLHSLSGQDDVVVGSATTGRPHADLEKMVADFVNMICLRNFPSPEKSFLQFLQEIKENSLAAYQNQDYPFDQLVEDLELERDFSRNPLVDVAFSYMNFDNELIGNNTLTMGDLFLKPYQGRMKDSTKVDMTLFCLEADTLQFTVEYCVALFKHERICRFIQYLGNTLRFVLEHPDTILKDIEILSESEKRQLLEEFNRPETELPELKTIHQIFRDQAEATPDGIALVGPGYNTGNHSVGNGEILKEDLHVTYRQLDDRSDLLVSTIRRYETGGNEFFVGILLDRGVDAVISILGILKAGGAYVPLDHKLPSRRLVYMMEDAGIRLVLSEQSRREQLTILREQCKDTLDIIHVDESYGEPAETVNGNRRIGAGEESRLAYIIYTSGTTGKPKGVMVEHKGFTNLREFYRAAPDAGGLDLNREKGHRVLQFAEFSFDASVLEIMMALLNGCPLFIATREIISDPSVFEDYMARNSVTAALLPPPYLAHLDPEKMTALKLLLSGGSETNRQLAERWAGKTRYVNAYGPTENTIVASLYHISTRNGELPVSIPIGRPVLNSRLYILDKNMELVPTGVPGELCVSGNQLARGYLNNPELTAEKFVQPRRIPRAQKDDFVIELSVTNFYKTGDLARWTWDGNIEFLGRIDHQVKIRGFRIELGEIEQSMTMLQSVKDAFVVALDEDGGRNFLCAFYISDAEIPAGELKRNLTEILPDYMIPARFEWRKAFPLTPNGKVDRQSLVNGLSREKTVEKKSFRVNTPVTNLERIVVEAWKESLNLEKVGLRENFFDLGGDSLSIIDMGKRLNRSVKKNIPVMLLLRYPTVESQARALAEKYGLRVESVSTDDIDENNVNASADTNSESPRRRTHRPVKPDIAVIGMAGRFPGAPDIERFWDNLVKGVESISFFTDEELEDEGVEPQVFSDPQYVKAGAVLENAESFDSRFFGYTPLEAQIMDPQNRVFHEVVVEALENAGYGGCNTHNSEPVSIGLYAGASSSQYWEFLVARAGLVQTLGEFAATNLTNRDFMCTRVAYNLNLNGPAFSVQTACSTSLTSIHQAGLALLTGECDIALAGGVSVVGFVKHGYRYEEGMIASSDGHCRAFDNSSDGTVFGSGAGVVVLKPLDRAMADGDHIYAVVKGSAVNNDGNRKVGYTAPSIEGQAEVIREAQQIAGVEPETVTYIEAHGTGTALGDPVEVEALTEAFNTEKRGFCGIGSVKTNVGHLDAAAGVAGFIKTVLALYHKRIPSSLNFEIPNQRIDFENSPFYVNQRLKEWTTDGGPLRAGVSSFGIGGTNAHVILEEAPLRSGAFDGAGKPRLLILSAKTPAALDTMTTNLGGHLKKSLSSPDSASLGLADTAYTLAVGRDGYRYRRMVVCSDLNEAVEVLTAPETEIDVRLESRLESHQLPTEEENPPVVFMFPGQGAQYIGMCRELYDTEPVFRQEMDQCFEIIQKISTQTIKSILYPPDSTGTVDREHPDKKGRAPGGTDINQTEITQPLIFSVEYALARLMMAWGITPDAMIGHSIGEYAAACLAGVMSLEDALRVVINRGKLMQGLPPGAMLSVPLGEEQLNRYLKHHDGVSIAALNSTGRSVVSGTFEAVEAFENRMTGEGVETRRLHTSHAFHSAMMDPVLGEFETVVKNVELKEPRIPYVSNRTGDWVTVGDIKRPAYWSEHLRGAVRFSDGLERLLEIEKAIFLEVGPGNVLSTFVRKHEAFSKDGGRNSLNLVRHPREKESDRRFLLRQVGKLWLLGKSIDWRAFYSDEKRCRVPLPTYPFQREDYRLRETGTIPAIGRNTLRREPDAADWFYVPTWERNLIRKTEKQVTTSGTISETGSKRSIKKDLLGTASADNGWLVFYDPDETGRLMGALVHKLEQEGAEVVTVSTADSFVRENGKRYRIAPGNEADYRLLFKHLKKEAVFPTRVLHLWSVTGESLEGESGHGHLDSYLETGLFSLMNIAKSLVEEDIHHEVRIGVVSDGLMEVTGSEFIVPAKAPLLGAIKTIPLEFPTIRCVGMDIETAAADGGANVINKLGERLINELEADGGEPVVAFRGNYRWTRRLKPYRLEDNGEIPRLKEKGVYLVTGGLGGIGLTLAEYLARTVSARLILVGRSALPNRDEWSAWEKTNENTGKSGDSENSGQVAEKIRRLLEIEQSGGEIMTVSADVADLEQMKRVLADAHRRFGRIDGVLHAAGTADKEGVILRRSRSITEKVMGAKIQGTLVLDTLLAEEPPDFMMLFSSLATEFHAANYGQVGYVAANEFLDAFAAYNMSRGGVHTVAVNWCQWQEVGMAADAYRDRGVEQTGSVDSVDGLIRKYGAVTPGEGVEVFRRILESDLTRVAVSPIDLDRLLEEIRYAIEAEEAEPGAAVEPPVLGTTVPRPDINVRYVAPRNDTERKLANIWKTFFGLQEVGVTDDFFELGGDSLLAVRIVSKINDTFGVKLPSHALLRETTIEAVARLITGDGSEQSDTLVCIQEGTVKAGKTPLFLVHPIGGHVYFYRDLAVALGPEVPVYALQARGLDGVAEPIKSIEEMAAYYLREIRARQPEGPYSLGGSSFGGMVVYEMARLLCEEGQEVSMLFMVDTPGPGYMPKKFTDDADILAYYMNADPSGSGSTITADMIRNMTDPELTEFIRQYGVIDEAERPDNVLEHTQQLLRVFNANLDAMFNYVPGEYPGDLMFFRATEETPNNAKTPEKAWIPLVTGEMKIYDVPGDHISMNLSPNVEVMAKVVKDRQ